MAETKIVKSDKVKHETIQTDEPRVTVKAAVIPKSTQDIKHQALKALEVEEKRPSRKLPLGKPVFNKELEERSKRAEANAQGATVPKVETKKEEAKKSETSEATKNQINEKAKEDKNIEKTNSKEQKETSTKKEVLEKTEKQSVQDGAEKSEAKDKKNEAPKGDRTHGRAGNKTSQADSQVQRDGNRDGNRDNQRGYQRDGNRSGQRDGNRDGQKGYQKDGKHDSNRDGQRGYQRDGNRPYNKDQKRNDGRANNFTKDRFGGGFAKDKDEDVRQSKPRQKKTTGNSGLAPLETKRNQKEQSKRNHVEKERDKFSKLEGGSKEGGKKNKEKIKQRSLEKAAKPKKHSQYKAQVEEEEDILDEMPAGTIAITVPITVGGFCEQTEISMNKAVMTLMKMGIMANINQSLDQDTVELLAAELGISILVAKVEEEEVEKGIEAFEDKEEDLKPRAPFVTVMGHVDHGKTSLLDAIRTTNVATGEAGGITQHIGASEVNINGQKIVFLDTPGHEAFTQMRARGAHVTDIAVLVVAADDGVMPQTIESISHAKAAGVPIIVAINKMDKPSANPDRVKQELTEHGILVEDWGGDTICVPVSAKTRDGITNLLEMILLQAEVLELKANPNRMAMGSVIEARLDKNKGPVATLLVTNGTLKSGSSVVVGNCYGRIRLMTNYKGDTIKKAGPATAVEILGLDDVPEAGDEFNAVKEDKQAREIAENRKAKLREEVLARNASSSLEQLFSQIHEGEVKDLNLIIKGDVAGSIGAIVASLEKLNNENVRVKIVHTGVGTITESDVMLASTTGSIIIGFNVRPTTAVQTYSDRENVQIRLYRVIYNIINDIEDAMKGMLDPEFKEEILGKVEVRSTFKVPNVGIIAGAYVQEGKVVRNAEVRLVRDGIVIHEGKISSLKRFKDDAKEVNQGYECGIGIENYNDIKDGDVIECFHMVEIEVK